MIGENALQIALNPQYYIDNTYKRAGYFPPYEYYVISIAVMDRTQNKSSIPFKQLQEWSASIRFPLLYTLG